MKMEENKTLSPKQLAVLDDLLAGDIDESAMLEKHKITKGVYNRWLCGEGFKNTIESRIAISHLQARALIARFASHAAARLVGLTDSEKEETARKACLDIISLQKENAKPQNANDENELKLDIELDPATASKLLDALAEKH